MGTIDIASMLLLLVAVATAVVACVVMYRRKRRQAQSAAVEAQCKPAEEQRRKEEQEAVRRAPEVKQQLEVERRQLEEEACHKTEEAQQKVEDEARGKAEEEARQRAKEDEEKRRIPLGHRPPRRQPRPQEPSEKRPPQETKSRCPKPEIVCWQRERQWIPAVEIPEEVLENSGLTVLQDKSPLRQDESREACWRLEQASGEVVVRWNEGEDIQEAKVALGQDGYLLFKLSGENQNQGRSVKSSSSGSYLVVVPENWERDEALSGPPPVAPESVSLTGYQAHFFELEKDGDGKIAFLTPTGKPFAIKSKAPQFELVGSRLNDATENTGPLFGERPPKIRALDNEAWKDIGTIVIGEEGSGKRKWRKSFSPVPEKREQDLPPEVAARKDGWYFLRFYDTDDDPVESLDFRFVSALKDIKILQSSPFPSAGQHKPAHVEFHHEPGCAIRPADDPARSIQIESKDNETTLTIPPGSVHDETRWHVASEGKPRVEVTILVKRLWWAMGPEDNPPPEWKDEPLTLSYDDFSATSKKALWLRLPRRRWTDRVCAGFEQSRARSYTVKVTEKEISVPLREFGDCQEMTERDQDHFLNIWIERDGEPIEGIVAIIPASQGPILCIERGRKKTAVATAVLREGAGAIKVNGQPVADYFRKAPLRARQFLSRLLELPYVSRVLSQMEVSIEVTGSNPSTVQQAKASAHALARALMKYDSRLKPLLKQEGFGGARATKRSDVQ